MASIVETPSPLAERILRLFARRMKGQGARGMTSGSLRKIAVILPIAYRGGSLRGFKSVAKMLRHGSRLAGESVEIVAAMPAGAYDMHHEFEDLTALGISLRPFEWTTLDRAAIKRAMSFVSDAPQDLSQYAECVVPDDGINHLLDCDFWLVISDRIPKYLAPIRPSGLVIYDYIQQVRPDIFPSAFDDAVLVFNAQQAKFVICTTPFTAEAAMQYAGVRADRVRVVDMEIEVNLHEKAAGGQALRRKRPYILWPSNTSPHKNQLLGLDALELYFAKYDGRLDVICSGLNTHWFDLDATPVHEHNDPWIKSVRDRVARSRVLRKRVRFVGELSERDYFATLAGAQFLFHPSLVDNGTFAVTEAAWLGVPALSHDYPPMRWMDERFGLALAFCDARHPEDAARALLALERDCRDRAALLPTRESLARHGWREYARSYWATLRPLMESAP